MQHNFLICEIKLLLSGNRYGISVTFVYFIQKLLFPDYFSKMFFNMLLRQRRKREKFGKHRSVK